MAKRDFAFGKENFVWIVAAIVCIIFGWIRTVPTSVS